MIPDASGAVLSGGRGTRLGGVRKGLLRTPEGETLLARTMRISAELFERTLLVANEPAPYRNLGVQIVADPIPDRGAPGGLLAALSAAETPWVFLCACDMPALDPRVIEALAARRRPGIEAVVATVSGRPEPLHAFWSTSLRSRLEARLRTGEPSFRDVLTDAEHARVPVEELERTVPGAAASFANVNTPEDLARFRLERAGA